MVADFEVGVRTLLCIHPVRPAALLGFALVAGVFGCSRNANEQTPNTVPVTGKVIGQDGTPLSGGSLQFRPNQPSSITTVGAIDANGRFVLHSLTADGKTDGAPEGEYTAIVVPTSPDQSVEPVTVTKTFTVRAGEKNDFVIKLSD